MINTLFQRMSYLTLSSLSESVALTLTSSAREEHMQEMHVTLHQHPVGQGLFHSGSIRCGSAHFDYVYDCGSSSINMKRRTKLVEFYNRDLSPAKKPLDAVFVSHFDNDHVNGLDALLNLKRANPTARFLIMPYLSPLERFA